MKKFTWKLRNVNSALIIRRKWVYFLIVMLLPFATMADRVYPDMAVTVSSGGSDYQLTFNYSGAGVAGVCLIDYAWEFRIFKNTDVLSDAVQVIPKTGRQSSGTLTYVAGPSNGGAWALRYAETGTLCTPWVWSGYPRATSATKPAGYSVATYASTAAIKSPTGITASNQAFFDHIIINWAKGIDIPDGNVSYRIYKGKTFATSVISMFI